MTPSSDDGPTTHGLVMPFLPVASKGGPYDDDAYVAGYEMGLLDARLEHAARTGGPTAGLGQTVRTANRGQVDLLAMRHGYAMTARDVGDGWTWVELRPSAGQGWAGG